jgi:hypothetical protein
MPNAAPPARYDLPWKTALTHAFRAFMDFFFPDLCAQIDWARRPRFRDKELVGIGLNNAAQGLVADELVEVYLRDGRLQWVLIHVEIQAQRDVSFALRVLDYNYRIFKQYEQPVASLVLLADDDPEWRPNAFHNDVLGTVMGISFATAKLPDYADRSAALLASHNPFALVTLAHLRSQQAHHDADKLYTAKWQLTKLLYQHGWSKQRILVLFNVINWMMALPEAYQQQYWEAILQLERKSKMKWISPLEQSFIDKGRQKGLQEGLEKGIEKGIEKGRKEGAAALLEHQLTRRFGPLPQTIHKKLAKASVAQMGIWSDALAEADSLKQVFR